MAEIVNIDLETGDLSQFDSTVIDGGDLSAATGAAALFGVYGLQMVIDDTNDIYGVKGFTEVGGSVGFTMGCQFDPNSVTSSGQGWIAIMSGWNGATEISRLEFRENAGGDLQVRARMKDDGGTFRSAGNVDIVDASNWVEMRVIKASGSAANDGIVQMYLEAVQGAQNTGNDFFDGPSGVWPDELHAGAENHTANTVTGTIYSDRIKMRNDETLTGPFTGALPVPISTYYMLQGLR